MQPGAASSTEMDRFAHHLARVGSGHGFIAAPHPGLDLPPLNAALGERYGYGPLGLVSARDFSGAPSSYIRSGSNAPSRTHSPLNPGLAAAAAVGYMLPPPHAYYALGGHPHGHHTPPPVGHEAAMMNGMLRGGVPTIAELQQHCQDLVEHRKRYEEMIEKTDRMLAGVKRGIEEMLNASSSQPQQPQPSQTQASSAQTLTSTPQSSPQPPQQSPSIPPQTPSTHASPKQGSPSAIGTSAAVGITRPGDRDRTRDPIWPIVGESTATRE